MKRFLLLLALIAAGCAPPLSETEKAARAFENQGPMGKAMAKRVREVGIEKFAEDMKRASREAAHTAENMIH
jgi:hypothetical protein